MSVGVSKTRKTIGQLARSLEIDAKDVSKAARQVLGLPGGNLRDSSYLLTPHECAQIIAHLNPKAPPAVEGEADSLPEPPVERPLQMLIDPPAGREGLEFGELNHGLWVHPESLDAIQQHSQLQKRLGIVLQHLAAHGRTSVVKGCSDPQNQGWLRSPLGGSGGMQYYLWWAHQGARPVKELALPQGSIVVRAVRHHDDHALLSAGLLNHYLPFEQQEIEDDELIRRPWTEQQLQFVEADDPVRLILGVPGSGKTTVLWKAVDARSGQRVLYLTWSQELTRHASQHFKAFAPADTQVDARDFLSFLGEICRQDIRGLTLADSQAAFLRVIGRLQPSLLGPWHGKERALYAELRAFFVGRATIDEGSDRSQGLVRLADSTYIEQRGDSSAVGRAAAEALIRIVGALDDQTFEQIFPELMAASRAIERLQNDDLPEGFSSFDRVVVDEVQDLTLLEASVVVELCRAVARRRGHSPWLLVAGDDGQTVRPSGFDWGPLNDLIARRVATPRRFHLDDNLRCPSRIAEVVERASAKYAHLEKGRRPRKQRHRPGGQHVEAFLVHVAARSVGEAVELLERLEEVEGLVILSPLGEAPLWLPAELRDAVLTPADAKGLEYQSVVILEPGKLLSRFEPRALDSATGELEEHARRTTIDQLRVALSRATETLVFLDVEANESERLLSISLLDSPAPFDPPDLAAHFEDFDKSPEERVLARTKDARTLLEERPRRAWRLAYQALRLLGDRTLPNGVSTNSVRSEACHTLLSISARLLVDRVPEVVPRSELVEVASEAIRELAIEGVAEAFEQLVLWGADRSTSPLAMLDGILQLGDQNQWFRTALVGHWQALRQSLEDCASQAETAKAFAGEVGAWLALTGFAGDLTAESIRLRRKAFDTLLAARDFESAQVLLDTIEPLDQQRTASLQEAEGLHELAAETFEKVSAPQDALRNWRLAGNWERALPLAEEQSVQMDLGWLYYLQKLIDRRPEGHASRLTSQEKRRLRELLEEALSELDESRPDSGRDGEG